MGTIAEKLQYTLDSVNDIEEALKSKNHEFVGTEGYVLDKAVKTATETCIHSDNVDIIRSKALSETIDIDLPQMPTIETITANYNKEETNIDNGDSIILSRKLEAPTSDGILLDFYFEITNLPDSITFNVDSNSIENLIIYDSLVSSARSQVSNKLEEALHTEAINTGRTITSYAITSQNVQSKILSDWNYKYLNVYATVKNSENIVKSNQFLFSPTITNRTGIIRGVEFSNSSQYNITFDSYLTDITAKLTVTVYMNMQATLSDGSIITRGDIGTASGTAVFPNGNNSSSSISMTTTLTEAIKCNISLIPTFDYYETIIKTDYLNSYANFIRDIGKNSTVTSGYLLSGLKAYDPTTGGYIEGSMEDFSKPESEYSTEVYLDSDCNPYINTKVGFHNYTKINLKDTPILSREDNNLCYNKYSSLGRTYALGCYNDALYNFSNEDEFDFNFYMPKRYKDEYMNNYYASSYYKLHFVYVNKNLFIVPMSPTDTVAIVSNVPNRTYYTLATTSATTMSFYLHSVIRVDYSTFLITYEYDTVAEGAKTSGLYFRTLKFEEASLVNENTSYAFTWTLSKAILIGAAANTNLSGANYAEQNFYFFPLKDNVSNILEIGIGRTYDNYTSAGVHQKRTLYYNDIYRTPSSGALTLNSTAWTTLCSVAPSTASGYHFCKLFPSRYGGITFCSQTNVSNYTEKFVQRIDGRANAKATTITLNAANSGNELEGLTPLGRLKDGTILFNGERRHYEYYDGTDVAYSSYIGYNYVFYIKTFNNILKTFVTLGSFKINPYEFNEGSFLKDYESWKEHNQTSLDNNYNDAWEDFILFENNMLVHIPTHTVYQILQPDISYDGEIEYRVHCIKEGYSSYGSTDEEMPNYNAVMASPFNGIGTKLRKDLCTINGSFVVFKWYTNTTVLYYSSDGINWYAKDTTTGNLQVSNIVCGNERIIIMGVNSPYSKYSIDSGTTWTEMTGLDNGCNCIDIVYDYDSNRFILTCITSDNNYNSYYSTNGTSWTKMTGLDSDMSLDFLVYGNGRFIVIDNTDGKIFYSTNGTSWTESTKYTGNTFKCIAYGNGRFVTIDAYGYTYYSSDGINWSSGGFISQEIDNPLITYGGNGRFVVVGKLGASAYSIDNGTTWHEMSGLDPEYNYKQIIYNNGIFICLGKYYSNSSAPSGTNIINSYYSTNGTSWTKGGKGLEDTYIHTNYLGLNYLPIKL